MDKLTQADATSHDIVADNIDKLKAIFPEAVTEGKINFDALKETLGEYLETREERYNFSWAGKSKARRLAQTPSTGTLRPCPEESVDWDKTENLFIEGDNLEVLKLLQKSYQGQVKMIYIDPPYNTGGDFVYPDKYADNLKGYLEYTNQVDTDGNKNSSRIETLGRRHGNWLNMILPRLLLARNLLQNDGVVLISINDKECANLKKLCDEVYGEENFLAQFVWNTEGHTDNQYDVKVNHEYILAYSKSSAAELGYVIDPNTRKESNLWKGFAENSITKNGAGNPPSEVLLPVGFPCLSEEVDLPANCPDDTFFKEADSNGYISRNLTKSYGVSYPIRRDRLIVKNHGATQPCRVFSGWANVDKLKAFIANKLEPLVEDDGSTLKFYLSENGVIYYRRDRQKARNIVSVLRNMGTTEQMRSELEEIGIPFQYPKPKELIKYLIRVGVVDKGLVMDFFAGSGTTAQAVLESKADGIIGEGIHFILNQLPEILDPKNPKQREAFDFCYKSGFTANIAEISKERIRRVSAKIKQEHPDYKGDLGFKVFKLDSSNIEAWDSNIENLEDSVLKAANILKGDRSELDIVYELFLKYGLDLSYPVNTHEVAGKQVYEIGAGSLFICLEDGITNDFVEALIQLYETFDSEAAPRVVFKDSGFKSDAAKKDAEGTLKDAGILDVKCL